MFSYVFCDGMKLIQDAIRLPLDCPTVAVIMGLLVLLSEKPFSTSRALYLVWEEGGGSRNSEEIRRGAELILLLRKGGHDIIISTLKLISQPPPDNY